MRALMARPLRAATIDAGLSVVRDWMVAYPLERERPPPVQSMDLYTTWQILTPLGQWSVLDSQEGLSFPLEGKDHLQDRMPQQYGPVGPSMFRGKDEGDDDRPEALVRVPRQYGLLSRANFDDVF